MINAYLDLFIIGMHGQILLFRKSIDESTSNKSF